MYSGVIKITRIALNHIARRSGGNYRGLPVVLLSGCLDVEDIDALENAQAVADLGDNYQTNGLYNWSASLCLYTRSSGEVVPFIAVDSYRGHNLPIFDARAYAGIGDGRREILAEVLKSTLDK